MNTLATRRAGRRLRRSRPRHVIGFAILAGGAIVLATRFRHIPLALEPRVGAALIAGSAAALATALGTLPALVMKRIGAGGHALLLAFGGGVMLAASAFSLVVPGIAAAQLQGASPVRAALQVAAALLLGAFVLHGFDAMLRAAPQPDTVEARRQRGAWLFVLVILLHNLPEGLAIGVAYGGLRDSGARVLATGIAIQDVPEGLVVALALRAVGYGRLVAVGIGAASGLVEPVTAMLGAGLVGLSSSALPWGLGGAAGAMLAAIGREVIPDAYRQGRDGLATAGLAIGFALMTVLDTALG